MSLKPIHFAGALAALLLLSQPALALNETVKSEAGPIAVETIAQLKSPWGFAFLPDGEVLVTEKNGDLVKVSKDGKVSDPIEGVPEVWANGQGGLLDVALDPEFETNNYIYLTYAEPGKDGKAGTAAARGKLKDGKLTDVEVIFRQKPKIKGPNHFGSRLAFAPDGKLFITTGERFQFDPAQDLKTDLGKVIRINKDGSVPDDNPFVGDDKALPEIWSYGHRNVQGAAIKPDTGELWTVELGPKGGDEINKPEAGKNYGWPVVSWGNNYDDTKIPNPPTHPEFEDAVKYWNPVISPSGFTFYTGKAIPEWDGDALLAGMSSSAIIRLTFDGDKITGEERLDMGSRIRDVGQGPDGAVWALTDGTDGKLIRLTKADKTDG
ncbi:Soluble aldose sugar dehydrogenase YliI precursor [Methyloligella halotolerans]|uniref:Soluble aldose sugar dehydrogenase YliI n=1 Tax=Methyloligella halotolerans TaxID=1177755 RepID=A0A1E2RYQ9_9HYPH|nr:PQQ-dependent sugar dehydrogenase [Methyloligella halotolerans]ODA67290.1 Soluble aldose sugar dehydrogenase YliI precursor [Methyloligella halotolerans]